MTQHALVALPKYPGHTVLVGWRVCSHYSQNTFYASVFNASDTDCADDCPAHVTAPLAPDLITDAADIIKLVRPFAAIPRSLLPALKAEQAGNHRTAAMPQPRRRGSAAEILARFRKGLPYTG